jgi:hypothetical protein
LIPGKANAAALRPVAFGARFPAGGLGGGLDHGLSALVLQLCKPEGDRVGTCGGGQFIN